MSDNVALPPEDKLEEALALLAAGFSLDEALAEAGDDAEWLRPLLQTANEVAELAPAVTIPSPQASLARMLAHVDTMPVDRSNGLSPKLETGPNIIDWLRGSFLLGARPARGILIALVAAIVLMGSLTWTAQASLPGQTLYPIKQLSETVRLVLTFDPQARIDLEALFNLRRQAEVRQLLVRGQMAMISFTGRVTIISPTKIAVDGLELQLTALSTIEGDITEGAKVRVEVVTEPPDRIEVLALTVLEPGLAPAVPPATATSSPTATSEPTDGPDDTPTVTPEPTKTATATATVTPIPPTRTPVPSPTATPSRAVTDESFDNDGFDENFNDSFENAPPEDDSNDNSNTADDSVNDNSGEDFADDNFNDSEFNDEEFADDNSGSGDSGGGNDNEDKSGSGNSNDNDDKDNSGSGSSGSGSDDDKDNSGPGNADDDDDSSNSGSSNSGSGSNNSGKGSSNSGSGGKDDD